MVNCICVGGLSSEMSTVGTLVDIAIQIITAHDTTVSPLQPRARECSQYDGAQIPWLIVNR